MSHTCANDVSTPLCRTILSPCKTTTIVSQEEGVWKSNQEPEDFAADLLALNLARETSVSKFLSVIMYDLVRECRSSNIMFGKLHPSTGTKAEIKSGGDEPFRHSKGSRCSIEFESHTCQNLSQSRYLRIL